MISVNDRGFYGLRLLTRLQIYEFGRTACCAH